MREQVVRVCTFWVYQFSKQRCASAPEESFRSAISNVGKSFILESTCLLQIMCMFVYTYRKKIHDWRWRRITFLYPITLLYPILLRTQQEIHPISTTCSQQHIFNQKSSPINLPHWQNLGSSLDGSCCLHSVSPHDSAEISLVRCVLRNAFKFAKSFVSIWTTPRRGVELSTAGKEDDGAHGAQVEAQGKIGTFKERKIDSISLHEVLAEFNFFSYISCYSEKLKGLSTSDSTSILSTPIRWGRLGSTIVDKFWPIRRVRPSWKPEN